MTSLPVIATLIATCNRPKLLAQRALPSVAAQTHRPDFVVVVDDSLQQFRNRNRQTVEQFSKNTGIRALYLENHRNKGASGAWNTGALSILDDSRDTTHTYIAILDDDDEWLPEHLAQAEKATRRGADLIAAPFLRYERESKKLMRPPSLLRGNDFLIGNPGVGCGSLIIRLSTFCRAGMFDESMPACTDRDICFRISRLGNISYCTTKNASMIHYADDNRTRLSNCLGKNRLAGLSAFADKYRCWMTDSEYAAFQGRAKKLFGWQPSRLGTPSHPAIQSASPSPKKAVEKTKKIALIIGVIVPPKEKNSPLFMDIAKLAKDKRLSSLSVVIMPSSSAHVKTLRQECAKWRQMGIRIYCIDGVHATAYMRQFNIAANSRKQRPIAVNRTILQYTVSRIAKSLCNPVCWILDGDSRLHGLAMHEKKSAKFTPDYIGEMIRLRNSGCDVAIGGVNGAAPLPRASTVRTQMTDLLFCLARLTQHNSQHQPLATIAAMPKINISSDYYYDYGDNPHLEQPIGVLPHSRTLTYRRFITTLPKLLERILSGDAVTRPLFQVQKTYPDLQDTGKAPHRGGNTLIFNPQTFRVCPNGLVRGVFSGMRRQDEVWRIIGESSFGWKVTSGNFPVTQSRENDMPQAPDIERMATDIVGHAVCAGLRKVSQQKRFADVQSFTDFVLQDNFALFSDMRKAAQQRLTMVRTSFYRIGGIADSMRGLLDSKLDKTTAQNASIVSALKNIKSRFSQNNFMLIEKQTMSLLKHSALRKTLAQFPEFCTEFHQIKRMESKKSPWYAWLTYERRLNASALIQRLAVMNHSVRIIGHGREGTVFADGIKVCKVLHHWYSRADVTDPKFILSLCGKWNPDSDVVYPIIDYKRDGGDLLLFLPYEKTLPYRGGFGAGITAMLTDMRQRGVVLWNPSPENMRICGDKVRFIDYGNDLRPFTKKDFDISVRKIWLCWKWAWRNDLSALLSNVVTNPNLPELTGYEILKAATMQYAAQFRPNESVIEEVLSNAPCRVFDFGCGKSMDAVMLAQRGIEVCAYDPEITTIARCKYEAAGVKVLGYEQIRSGGVFDVVILHNVICEIKSDKALRQCLQDVHRLMSANGKVIVTVCNVDGISENTCASNILPRHFDMERKFLYQKRLRKNYAVRTHVHRPTTILLREFARAGFKIAAKKSFSDIDLERFEHCGGTLQWTLTPMPQRPSVSLIIRACAMDSNIAETQMRHLVQQLSFPRGFAEIILAIDNRAHGFLREHCSGDLSDLLDTAKKMQRQGVVDRIIVSPKKSEVEKIRKLNQTWAGINSNHTHALNGAPLSVVFAAFDICRTQYALHVDIDMLIGRTNKNHDYLGLMLQTMEEKRALTMSLNIAGASSILYEQKDNPFRLEVRAGLTNLSKLKTLLPLPFKTKNNFSMEGWHRAADKAVCALQLPSLRGGDQRLFMVHPPNHFKNHDAAMEAMTNAVEQGEYPEEQRSKNEWDGSFENWLPPPRREQFIFVVCGRNVDCRRINRCLDSIGRQQHCNWGVIIMDDASSLACATHLKEWVARHKSQATYFSRRHRCGGLSNLIYAVRYLCDNPQSVIVTLDMDDALFGNHVIDRLIREYECGADMTVGSMLRFDKHADYPVCFDNPYATRGGNVWQHLRSFRKRLFDAIPDAAMRDDDGEYFHLAEDWAYMLPITAMASHPVWIKDILYLYEPNIASKQASKHAREEVIGRIMKRACLIKKKGAP